MAKSHLFSRDSVRLETAPTGGVRQSYPYEIWGISRRIEWLWLMLGIA